MSPNVRIDQDVYGFLKRHAEPFVDTPNSVLRRLFNLPSRSMERPPNEPSPPKRQARPLQPARRPQRSRSRKPSPRVAPGALVPEQDYVSPLLSALGRRGGAAPAREVIEEIGQALNGKLTELDMAQLPSGGVRWQHRVHFARLRLAEEGLLAKDSPRGLWQLTDAGRAKLAEVEYHGS